MPGHPRARPSMCTGDLGCRSLRRWRSRTRSQCSPGSNATPRAASSSSRLRDCLTAQRHPPTGPTVRPEIPPTATRSTATNVGLRHRAVQAAQVIGARGASLIMFGSVLHKYPAAVRRRRGAPAIPVSAKCQHCVAARMSWTLGRDDRMPAAVAQRGTLIDWRPATTCSARV
jgi:hypothetical protein